MRSNNSPKSDNVKNSVRTSAARQSADKPTSLSERRGKVMRLPEERRTGTKYQIIKGQYIRQENKKETSDKANAAAIKKAADARAEKKEKSKRQTMAAKSVKGEKEKNRTIPQSNTPNENPKAESAADKDNETAKAADAKENYIKSAKAEEYTEKLKANVELNKAVDFSEVKELFREKLKADAELNKTVNISSAKKDSVYEQGGTAKERAFKYKEKADFYLNKMKKDVKTGKKEVNENRDKDVGGLYKKAYKLAHKEELLDKNTSTMFDKAQSVMQFKSEIDSALNQNSVGEAAAAVTAIPLVHAATTAVKKLSEKNKAVMTGKAAAELSAKITESISSSDNVGEATVNAITAAPKYLVEKKVEKTVSDVMKAQHERSIEAKKERLRQKQEKVEKRAQEMKKENMQRKMKVDLYKAEHGITSKGNGLLRNAAAAVKNTLESMKRAITAVKSSGMMITAAAGSALIPILVVGFIIIIVIALFVFPFFYLSDDGDGSDDDTDSSKIVESDFKDTVLHYYEVMDKAVDDINAQIEAVLGTADEYSNTGVVDPEKYTDYLSQKSNYDEYMADSEAYYDNHFFNPESPDYCSSDFNWYPTEPEEDYYYSESELYAQGMERGPIFEGFRWTEESTGTRVPKGQLYDEMLVALPVDNIKHDMTKYVYLNDDIVYAFYTSMGFWQFTNYGQVFVDCPGNGECCSKRVEKTGSYTDPNGETHSYTYYEDEKYCPGHYVIELELIYDFDLDKTLNDVLEFDEDDMELYDDDKKEFDKEKQKAGI